MGKFKKAKSENKKNNELPNNKILIKSGMSTKRFNPFWLINLNPEKKYSIPCMICTTTSINVYN